MNVAELQELFKGYDVRVQWTLLGGREFPFILSKAGIGKGFVAVRMSDAKAGFKITPEEAEKASLLSSSFSVPVVWVFADGRYIKYKPDMIGGYSVIESDILELKK